MTANIVCVTGWPFSLFAIFGLVIPVAAFEFLIGDLWRPCDVAELRPMSRTEDITIRYASGDINCLNVAADQMVSVRESRRLESFYRLPWPQHASPIPFFVGII